MNKIFLIIFSIIIYSLFVGILETLYINKHSKKRHRIEILDVDDVGILEKNVGLLKDIIDFFCYYFYCLCLILSRGFFFIFYVLFLILYKITNINLFFKAKNFVHNISEKPVIFLIILIVVWTVLFYQLYIYSTPDIVYVVDDNLVDEVVVDNSLSDNSNGVGINNDEKNLYRFYSSYSLSDINFNKLKQINNDVVSWIIVDNTNINYPVLKTNNNDYYLSHDINNNFSVGGWVFMDYRNNELMDGYNTIFYGHNLINNTSFGGLSKLFTDSWFKKSNHKIIVLNSEHKYTYEVFSTYYWDAEIYYLTTNFYSNDEYISFLNTIKDRSIHDYDVKLDANDKIITLSTCTDDNNGRKVVHAKLVKID